MLEISNPSGNGEDIVEANSYSESSIQRLQKPGSTTCMGSLIDIWKFSALSIPNNELCDASCGHIRLGTVKCSPALWCNPHCAHQKLELLRNIPRVTGQKVDYITICFKSSCFWQYSCRYELTATETAFTRPEQDQTNQTLRMFQGRDHEVPLKRWCWLLMTSRKEGVSL